jgi:hypothetical protein
MHSVTLERFDRYPAHQPRVGEALAPAPRLPDALVGLLPVLAHPFDDASEVFPSVVVDRPTILIVEVDRVDELPVDVQLQLVGGSVAHSYRSPAAVPFEVPEHLLRELGTTVNAVHDL